MEESQPTSPVAQAPKSAEDGDTCRICRGEGTSEEPLFHPCKCSGSIGHVHQECLMEWLSHSQKKHCELCKTSFRFTKLYDPNMPSTLPFSVFIQRASSHTVEAFILWCRAALVFLAWFVWLPWCMRFVWWGLFWIADGAWSYDDLKNITSVNSQSILPLPNNSSVPLLKNAVHFFDTTYNETHNPYLLNLFRVFSTTARSSSSNLTTTLPNVTIAALDQRNTLLSHFSWLNHVTSNVLVNNFVLDVMEGGIITFSIVAAFILVFLIREWVVQQQPILNLDANNAVNVADNPRVDDVYAQIRAHVDQEAAALNDGDHNEATDAEENRQAEQEDPQPAIATSGEPAAGEQERADGPSQFVEEIGSLLQEADQAQEAAMDTREDHEVSDEELEGSWQSTNGETRPDPGTAQDSQTGGHSHVPEETVLNSDPADDDAEQSEHSHESNPPQAQDPQPSLTDRLLMWMWNEEPTQHIADTDDEDEEHVVEDLDDEAPFVRVQDRRLAAAAEEAPAEPQQQGAQQADQDALQQAIGAAGPHNDQDIQEDVEDLEGLLELVGFQGPLAGLFQNAIFVAVVISATIGTAIWFPYVFGKAAILVIAYPVYASTLPYLFVEGALSFGFDLCIWFFGEITAWIDSIVRLFMFQLSSMVPFAKHISRFDYVGNFAKERAATALQSLEATLTGRVHTDIGEYFHFSLSSHVALRKIQGILMAVNYYMATGALQLCNQALNTVNNPVQSILRQMKILFLLPSVMTSEVYSAASILTTWRWTINIDKHVPASFLNPALAYWDVTDRTIAIFAGYGVMAALAAIYLTKIAPLSSSSRALGVETAIVEVLQQAGGVCKVILIISIEMLVFPLYCGYLLDFAMLPLFGDSTFASRIAHTLAAPWTSIFFHWFIGTCYMFHFALFVSMCRKILRSGVLYFIRDPDDPTFHPVRDVLERSVTSQLRKIAFSALIYGALVIVCLGSIVWILAGSVSGILPIRWMPADGIAGFPLDLLLYTTLKPLAVRLLSPIMGLNVVYEWWFRKCADGLRLSSFLFDKDVSQDRNDTSGNVDVAQNDGGFARVPASDQVRIPRGQRVFVAVDENNNRIDGKAEQETGNHGKDNKNFKRVYIPSRFKTRIFAFIFCLWALTAVVGLGLSIVPLLIGRGLVYMAIPRTSLISDIYCISIGLMVLGGFMQAIKHREKAQQFYEERIKSLFSSASRHGTTLKEVLLHGTGLVYFYTVLSLVIPVMLGLLIQFYITTPLQLYFKAGQEHQTHVICLVQDWTIGVQYLRIIISLINWDSDSRLSKALCRVVANGWLRPDISLATKGFFAPTTVAFCVLMLYPASIGDVAMSFMLKRLDSGDEARKSLNAGTEVLVRRLSYPAVLCLIISAILTAEMCHAVGRWRSRIKDEVYLIGERLHNYGEHKPPKQSAASKARIKSREH